MSAPRYTNAEMFVTWLLKLMSLYEAKNTSGTDLLDYSMYGHT